MKNLILIGLLFVFAFSQLRGHSSHGLTIKVGTKFAVSPSGAYDLACEGAQGSVSYHVDGLPEGVRLEGDRLFVSSSASAGNYIIRIRASDESGQAAERILTLSIVHQEVEGGAVVQE